MVKLAVLVATFMMCLEWPGTLGFTLTDRILSRKSQMRMASPDDIDQTLNELKEQNKKLQERISKLEDAKTRESEWQAAIVGDLHFDPRFMDDHFTGQQHIKKILDEGPKAKCVVSLGDLGESKAVEEGTAELFAGTTRCFELARQWFDGFQVPFEVIGGNHDLEGIDEFPTDDTNLEAYLRILGKPTPQFKRYLAPKVVLLGLGSTVFRESRYTSHEVFIDEEQINWFEQEAKAHPASDGWKIFVFSHAPPNGSGLRVLQENHVINGCCWLNHSAESCSRFIKIVRENLSIKAWFSAHFHLGQNYEDSITFPTGKNRGECIFVQTSVMGGKSTRDGFRQSRLIRGTPNGFEICSINHAKNGELRLDVSIQCDDEGSCDLGILAHPSEDYDHDKFFSAYTPEEEDGCYIDFSDEGAVMGDVCWWHMACGRVLGKHNGMLLEYDQDTLAPLGLVAGPQLIRDRSITIVDSGIEKHEPGSPLYANREQAIVFYSETDPSDVTVIHPNEDGSYWRKIVRNKVTRMREKRREKAAIKFVREQFKLESDFKPKIENTWGPYTTTEGNAIKVKDSQKN